MFVRSALLLTAAGVAIGIGAAAALTQFMKSLLFNVSPLDPLTYVAVPLGPGCGRGIGQLSACAPGSRCGSGGNAAGGVMVLG